MDEGKITLESVRWFVETELLQLNRKSSEENKDKIGIELETFPLVMNDLGMIAPAKLYSGKSPLILPLLKQSETHGGLAQIKYSYISSETELELLDVISFRNGNKFLFEPGGQIEISTGPYVNLEDVERQLVFCQSILNEISNNGPFKFEQTGLSPINFSQLTNQLQKPRYIALENYLNHLGPYGREMMLCTCALHINIDLGNDDTTKTKRILVANLLVPFTSAIFSNSYLHKKSTGTFKSYRTFIWQNTDPTRTGLLKMDKALKTLAVADIVDAYYNFILDAPVIYINNKQPKQIDTSITLRSWIENDIQGTKPTPAQLRQHVSLLFPEVRLKKGYLELRSVDAPPLKGQMLPLCFYMGLLFDEASLDKTLLLLKPYFKDYDAISKASCFGLKSSVVYELSKKVMEISLEGCHNLSRHRLPSKYISDLEYFNERFLYQRKTFADDKK